MVLFDLQKLTLFAAAFANGFVFQNEPILRGSVGSFSSRNGFVYRRRRRCLVGSGS